jgi:hypothetical protein
MIQFFLHVHHSETFTVKVMLFYSVLLCNAYVYLFQYKLQV